MKYTKQGIYTGYAYDCLWFL